MSASVAAVSPGRVCCAVLRGGVYVLHSFQDRLHSPDGYVDEKCSRIGCTVLVDVLHNFQNRLHSLEGCVETF